MTPMCIFASTLLTIGILLILMKEKFHKEEIDQNYTDLTLNETMIQEYILVEVCHFFILSLHYLFQ